MSLMQGVGLLDTKVLGTQAICTSTTVAQTCTQALHTWCVASVFQTRSTAPTACGDPHITFRFDYFSSETCRTAYAYECLL